MADYAIIRVAKYHKTDLPGIQKHMGRQGECLSNPDIDPSRKNDNIALRQGGHDIAGDVGNLTDKVNKRLSQVPHKKAIRKDAVVLCDVLVTYSPSKDLDYGFDAMAYFSQALDFIGRKYGKDNIMYAVIHRDETTPHMDVGFVPLVGDRLCAKELLSRKNLIQLHDDFAREVGQRFGLERGKRRLDGQAYVKHLTDLEYKTKTKEAELSDKISKKRQELAKVTPKMPKKRSTWFGLRSEYDDKAIRTLARQAAAGRADLRELHEYASMRRELDAKSQELDKREAAIKAREDEFEQDYGDDFGYGITPAKMARRLRAAEAEVKRVNNQNVKYAHILDQHGLLPRATEKKSRGITRNKTKSRDELER